MMDCSGSDPQPSSLQSICHVRASELYPKATLQVEDSGGGGTAAGEDALLPLTVPFTPVCGEAVEFLGRTSDGILALSNYRLFLQMSNGTSHNIPLGLIEQLEVKDIFYLHVLCKDARSPRLVFPSNDVCLDWFRRLLRAIAPPKSIEQLFAFSFYAWSSEEGGEVVARRLKREPVLSHFRSEVDRLQFDLYGPWRISKVNEQGELCSSYPRELLVPSCIPDQILVSVASFRSYKRIPAVVWRHKGNGAVLARCSQPEVGWLGWRSPEDEELLKAIAMACASDRGNSVALPGPTNVISSDSSGTSGNTQSAQLAVPLTNEAPTTSSLLTLSAPVSSGTPLTNGAVGPDSVTSECNGGSSRGSSLRDSLSDEVDLPPQGKKLLIMDARSYTTAVANRARGGGCECPEYYPTCEIQFMNLANIHSIRKSFHSLRAICASAADQQTWLSLLEGTRWFQHMSGLMRSAVTVAQALDREGRPVVVHCSDGWDRTPQIVALAEILLDPFYRTMQGFQVLCEREWLDFGHKFADRCGHSVGGDDHNERCPVFLQWLDCVHQLLLQFPCSFEFSDAYLVKLVQHTYSNLFGTFLCNSSADRKKLSIIERTFSVWRFLQADSFKNHLYRPQDQEVLWPLCHVSHIKLWNDLYLGSEDRATSTLSPAPAPVPTSTTHSAPGSVNGSTSVQSGDTSDQGDVDDGEPTGGLTKHHSYDDIIAACEERDVHCSIIDQPRRCSDSSINVDLKFVNGTVTLGCEDKEDEEQQDGSKVWKEVEKRGECESDQEKEGQLESELSCAVMGLSFVEPIHVLDTPLAVSPVTHQFNSGSREEPSDDEDEDTEITVTTEVPQSVDIIESESVRTQSPSHSFDGGGAGGGSSGDCEVNESLVARQALNGIPKTILQSFDPMLSQPVLSVDSSTDTLVAPDQLSTNVPASSLVAPQVNVYSSSLPPSGHISTMTSSASVGPIATFPFNTNSAVLGSISAGIPDGEMATSSGGEMCRVCANSRRFLADNHRDHSGSSSRYSTPPLQSRTPSGTPSGTPIEEHTVLRQDTLTGQAPLDDVDGLASTQSEVQIRLQQIIAGYKTRIQVLERDLHLTLMALTQQVCHQCNQAPPDRNDDVRSLPESACSGEPASAGESLPSDVSWEALEELPDGNPILWVPDHASNRCMRCSAEFSMVRRRHHCRNCGKIFCGNCSENTVPLPNEQLYEPVRVCSGCYATLLPDQQENSGGIGIMRRNSQLVTNGNHIPNGHTSDVPADMAESALTFAHHHHPTSGSSCGFSYAAVTSGSAHSDARLGDAKLSSQQTQTQPRKAAAAYV